MVHSASLKLRKQQIETWFWIKTQKRDTYFAWKYKHPFIGILPCIAWLWSFRFLSWGLHLPNMYNVWYQTQQMFVVVNWESNSRHVVHSVHWLWNVVTCNVRCCCMWCVCLMSASVFCLSLCLSTPHSYNTI